MNCEYVLDNLSAVVSGELRETELVECKRHIAGCENCRDALHGTEALYLLKSCDTVETPAGLFDAMVADVTATQSVRGSRRSFWLGTGVGGAVAASLLAIVVTLGWLAPSSTPVDDVAEFTVSTSEPRNLDVAIETDRPLDGATISIVLAGDVQLDGYGGTRELSWTTDLDAGVNRLRLPVRANSESGGRMFVRLDHPDSRQSFVVRLTTGA